ncbi:MAG: hypothetical protein Q9190_001032 [Brigantiaea leucoxantha]
MGVSHFLPAAEPGRGRRCVTRNLTYSDGNSIIDLGQLAEGGISTPQSRLQDPDKPYEGMWTNGNNITNGVHETTPIMSPETAATPQSRHQGRHKGSPILIIMSPLTEALCTLPAVRSGLRTAPTMLFKTCAKRSPRVTESYLTTDRKVEPEE